MMSASTFRALGSATIALKRALEGSKKPREVKRTVLFRAALVAGRRRRADPLLCKKGRRRLRVCPWAVLREDGEAQFAKRRAADCRQRLLHNVR